MKKLAYVFIHQQLCKLCLFQLCYYAQFYTMIPISICISFSSSGNSARQCCYNAQGQLIEGPRSGGHADYISPKSRFPTNIAFLIHFNNDLTPFLQCCKIDQPLCSAFYSQRPSTLNGSTATCEFTSPNPGILKVCVQYNIRI